MATHPGQSPNADQSGQNVDSLSYTHRIVITLSLHGTAVCTHSAPCHWVVAGLGCSIRSRSGEVSLASDLPRSIRGSLREIYPRREPADPGRSHRLISDFQAKRHPISYSAYAYRWESIGDCVLFSGFTANFTRSSSGAGCVNQVVRDRRCGSLN